MLILEALLVESLEKHISMELLKMAEDLEAVKGLRILSRKSSKTFRLDAFYRHKWTNKEDQILYTVCMYTCNFTHNIYIYICIHTYCIYIHINL